MTSPLAPGGGLESHQWQSYCRGCQARALCRHAGRGRHSHASLEMPRSLRTAWGMLGALSSCHAHAYNARPEAQAARGGAGQCCNASGKVWRGARVGRSTDRFLSSNYIMRLGDAKSGEHTTCALCRDELHAALGFFVCTMRSSRPNEPKALHRQRARRGCAGFSSKRTHPALPCIDSSSLRQGALAGMMLNTPEQEQCQDGGYTGRGAAKEAADVAHALLRSHVCQAASERVGVGKDDTCAGIPTKSACSRGRKRQWQALHAQRCRWRASAVEQACARRQQLLPRAPSSMSVKDQAVPLILPRPGMVVEGMYADSMPIVTPCVMAMWTPIRSAPSIMPG